MFTDFGHDCTANAKCLGLGAAHSHDLRLAGRQGRWTIGSDGQFARPGSSYLQQLSPYVQILHAVAGELRDAEV